MALHSKLTPPIRELTKAHTVFSASHMYILESNFWPRYPACVMVSIYRVMYRSLLSRGLQETFLVSALGKPGQRVMLPHKYLYVLSI